MNSSLPLYGEDVLLTVLIHADRLEAFWVLEPLQEPFIHNGVVEGVAADVVNLEDDLRAATSGAGWMFCNPTSPELLPFLASVEGVS